MLRWSAPSSCIETMVTCAGSTQTLIQMAANPTIAILATRAPPTLVRSVSQEFQPCQWSFDRSNVKGALNASRIARTSVLQIENGADDAVPATHGPIVFGALATPQKKYVRIDGATHYYLGQPESLATCISTVKNWWEGIGRA
jgi:hypothetical protein